MHIVLELFSDTRMPLSESDASADEFNDSSDETSDDEDDENKPDLGDVHNLTSSFNSLMSTVQPENLLSHSIQPAFGVSSTPPHDTATSLSIFDDSIRAYIETSSLFQPTVNASSYYLTIDRIVPQSDKLFVSNVNYIATKLELKNFFENLNYDVTDIKLPLNSRNVRHSFFE